MSADEIPNDAKVWESAIRKLRGGFMPPPGTKRHPDQQAVKGLISWLETTLDTAQADPRPGRVPLRRLNRREYANAVRDLVGIKVDAAALLPVDDKKNGFDNNAASLQVSPSFLDQYLLADRTVALQAVGNPKAPAVTTTYGPVADMVISLPPRGTPGEGNHQLYKEGMPFGTRGGASEENAIEVLRVLHAAGADVNVVAKIHHLQRVRGGTALHFATRMGWKKAIEELVSYGIDVNAKDEDGLTALDYAMSRGYIPFLGQKAPVREDRARLLRDAGATVELAKTPDWPPVGPPIGYEATIWPL